ncbi:hypothetical protein BJV82DRAFT_617054 [Fennellomyces sp. T-0311]|nr:hypothetical protein BJV82DRAFT_617054 [Fennellomyces sp. T-0311]
MVKLTAILALTVFAAAATAYDNDYLKRSGCGANKEPLGYCNQATDCCFSEDCNHFRGRCVPRAYFGCPVGKHAGAICDGNDECCDNEECKFYPGESETGLCELKSEFNGCPVGRHSSTACDGHEDCCPGEACNFYMDRSETGICEPLNATMCGVLPLA